MARLRAVVRRVATSASSVLIQGESGVGKELVAIALHEESGRGPFVSVAVPELADGLLESELFGHARGAFTGAFRGRVGLFEAADGGTLFLDEIGDAPPGTQAKLLRVLESREVRRLGTSVARRVDVRVIAATHRDLVRQVADGSFREDLFYRIRGALIAVPPLRDRGDDVRELTELLLAEITVASGQPRPELGEDFARAISRHFWAGNVRELRSVLEQVVLWWDRESRLGAADLLEALVSLNPGLISADLELACEMIAAWRRQRGNQEAARRELGLTRAEWRSRIARLGLDGLRRRG
jgi:two-component system response regulator HydG